MERVLGVWNYNEARNRGFSQLLNRNVETIAGCQPQTSWVCYFCIPFENESKHIAETIWGMMKNVLDQIQTIPFSMPTDSFSFGGKVTSKIISSE